MPIRKRPRLARMLLPLAAALWLAPAPRAARAAEPSTARPVAVLAPPGEPGERLVVTGRLFARDGRTALPGVRIELWQTDANGLYAPDGSMEPRLRAELVTGARGEYEIRTIRPAPYPDRPIPAHIHYRVRARGGAEMFELRFEDDTLVARAERERSRREGAFGEVRPLRRDADGTLRAMKDLRLRGGD